MVDLSTPVEARMKGSRLLYAILFAALAAMAIAEEEGAKTEETPEPLQAGSRGPLKRVFLLPRLCCEEA